MHYNGEQLMLKTQYHILSVATMNADRNESLRIFRENIFLTDKFEAIL
jgi:hypothetical protein